MSNHTKPQTDDFAADVLEGLSAIPKRLSSKYFYDDEGSKLFVEIMKLPEYYLTRCELDIFKTQADEIYRSFKTETGPFDLIELGAGDGSKTSLLVEQLMNENADFRYVPVDISAEALRVLTEEFEGSFEGLEMRAHQGDYSHTLSGLSEISNRRKIVLFLGSNIGNFLGDEAIDFFKGLRKGMNERDLLLTGFDLHKNPKTILKAYDDDRGVTERFNLNLLTRINRELNADFDTNAFRHYASYHPIEKAARSFLISQKKQTVTIGATQRKFEFAAWEPIFMEISQKYDSATIESLAQASGFAVVQNFFDRRDYFVDSLWQPAV